MTFLASFLFQRIRQKWDNKNYFSHWKIQETHIFLDLFSQKWFHALLKFLQFIDNQSYNEDTCSSKRQNKLKPILNLLYTKFGSAHTV
jgi:hypothetical protein